MAVPVDTLEDMLAAAKVLTDKWRLVAKELGDEDNADLLEIGSLDPVTLANLSLPCLCVF